MIARVLVAVLALVAELAPAARAQVVTSKDSLAALAADSLRGAADGAGRQFARQQGVAGHFAWGAAAGAVAGPLVVVGVFEPPAMASGALVAYGAERVSARQPANVPGAVQRMLEGTSDEYRRVFEEAFRHELSRRRHRAVTRGILGGAVVSVGVLSYLFISNLRGIGG